MPEAARPAPGLARHPERKIGVVPYRGTVTVKVGDVLIAKTRQAKRLDEEGAEPVYYIPFADISFANLERTDTKTHCPYKGDASYWRLATAGEDSHDVMWAYEEPYREMSDIANHGAFYGDRVTIERSAD